MKKDYIERECRKIGVIPEAKVSYRGGNILIADGLVNNKGKAWLVKTGAMEIGEFPDGVYMTLWCPEEKGQLYFGKPLFFDKNHDPHMTDEARKQGRLQAALNDAILMIERARKIHAEPN